jgi:hypothetical protein
MAQGTNYSICPQQRRQHSSVGTMLEATITKTIHLMTDDKKACHEI